MNTHNPILKTLSAFLALTSFVTWAVPVYADNLPAGYEAVAGGSFYTASPDGTTGNLTATDEATIGQWNGGFNIGAGNTFNAYLPSGDSVHLSRDITANPSEIFGALNVPQGKFFLVNSSGIFFAPGSQVNAAGLVASTLDINNQDFLSGRYHFAQSANANPASVVSAGTMNIGTNGAALIGGAVANRGVILAQGSSLVLAAGSEATVSFDNSGQLSVLVDKGTIETVKDNDGAAIKDAVLNKGIVKTEGGIVVMTAEAANSIFDNLVNNTGIIEAQSLGTKEGKIVLSSKQSEGIVMNSGTLDASGKDAGEKGGKVVVEGQIAVNQGTIDVSGDANGGIVLLGGDYQGLNPGIRNADYTYVGDNSVIKADSLFQGDGGKIVLWSDKVTQSRGWIFARGGVAGGDGGFVETSSRGYLDVVNPVDASAANGNAGLWLLDPTDIVITSATDNQLNTSGTNPIVYSPTGSASRVTNTTIQTALNAGTSVTVSTVGSPGSPGHSGDITVNASITKTGGSDATFTLLAADDITVNNAISSNTNLLNVTFTAGGQITLNDGGSVTSNGGDVTFTAGDNVSIEDTINAGTGDILITTTGDVTLGSTVTTTTGSISIENADDVNVNADVTAGASLTINNTNKVSLAQNVDLRSNNGALSITNAVNGVSLTGAAGTNRMDSNGGSVTTGNITATSNATLVVTSQQDITVGNVTLNAGSLTADVDSDSNGTHTFDAGNLSASSIAVTGTGLTDHAEFNGTVTSTVGSILVDNFNSVDFDQDVTGATTTTVSNANQINISQNADIQADNGDLNLATNVGQIVLAGPIGNVLLDSDGGSVITSDIVSTGDSNLTIHSQGNVTVASANINDAALIVNVDDNNNGANAGTFGALTADTVTVTGTSGNDTLNFNGAINASGNVQATAGAINVNAPVTTTNNGAVSVTNAGTLNIAAAGDMNLDGAFLQDGAGLVNTAGDITTTADNITFTTGVTLTGPVSMDSNNGNINFLSTIDGAQNLTLESNAGDITMNAGVGLGTRLAALLVTAANNWTTNAGINAASIVQSAGTGLTDFNGALDANGAAGINVTTANVNFDANATASAGNIRANAANDINVNGTLNASQDIDLQAGNDLTQAAAQDMLAGRDAKMDANNALTLNGTVGAGTAIGRNIEIGQRNNNADVIANAMTADGAVTVNGDDITLNGTVIADFNIAGGEALNVSANDKATSNLNVNAGMFTTGGAINLTANNNVNMAAAGDVTSNNGNVLVRADLDGNNAGALTMTYGAGDQTVVNSGTGTATLRSGGDIALGRVVTTNATDAAVTIQTSAGRIIDGGENVAFDVDAANGGLVMSAANGIGLSTDAFGAIETNARRLSATTSTGDINVDVTSVLPFVLANASVTGGAGNILIRQLAELSMTVLAASTVNGSITLSSFNDLIVSGNITAAGALAAITLIADANGNGTGSFTQQVGSVINGGNGPVIINGVAINQFGQIISNGLVTLSAVGSIVIEFISANSFQITAVNGNITNRNGDSAGLRANETSLIEAGGVIGTATDPIRINLAAGDLIASAFGKIDEVSMNFAGTIPGDLIANLAPGLVMLNNLAVAGAPIPTLDTNLAAAFNLISMQPAFNGFNDTRTMSGLMLGNALSKRYEKLFQPSINMAPIESAATVLVSPSETKKWTRRAVRPVAAPVVTPQVVTPAPPVVTPVPVVEVPVVKIPTPIVTPAARPFEPPVMPFPTAPPAAKPTAPATPVFKPAPTAATPVLRPTTPLPGARLFQQSIEEEQTAPEPAEKSENQ